MQKKESHIGIEPIKTEKQRIESDGLKRTSMYNYKDMNEDVLNEQQGFARNLSALRVNKGISAREMSLSLGQGPSYINDIENGRALPSISMFFEICEYLKITPLEFFEYVSDGGRDISAELNQILIQLPKEDQLLLLEIAEHLQRKK